MSDKQLILDAVQRMSESATLDEISGTIAILTAIRRGEAAADAGQVIAHDEVKRRSATWTTK
jgi:predicted transcriptional regulator